MPGADPLHPAVGEGGGESRRCGGVSEQTLYGCLAETGTAAGLQSLPAA